MAERKHTAGPWFIRKRPTDDGLAVIEDGRLEGLFPITCEWNEAPLVAAAPDMADALAPFAAWAEAFKANVSTLHADNDPLHKALMLGPDLAPLTIGDMRRALAALSRAKGD